MAGTGGVTTAVELAGGAGEAPGAGEQAELFGRPVAPEQQPVRRSGPQGGRPAGSRNRRTEEWVRYLLGRHGSPLEKLLELAQMRPADLARELGLYAYSDGKPVLDAAGNHVLATGEAFRAQIQALTAALPYVHQKLPQSIEVKPRAAGVLVIGDIGASGESDLALAIAEAEENQGLIDVTPLQSDDDQSDGTANPRRDNDVST